MSKIPSIIVSTLLIVIGSWTSLHFSPAEAPPKDSVYEIRNYNIDPDHLESYKTWITNHGLPYIRNHMDVVGFWLEGGIESEINGAPIDELGSANVTWVIRWDSKDQRDKTMDKAFNNEEWKAIFAKFPGGSEAYLRVEIKYFDGI